uniref:Methyltransferase n=1 Tax=Chlorobium chlorochromatii (strain CaD3) TaxID=340177 RepID=Q3AQN0_CHLCH
MQILAGQFRGQKIGRSASAAVRPCSSRVKKSLFDTLAVRMDLEDAHVLDIFAGFGSLGFEALSRGAASVTFVDRFHESLKALKSTAAKLGVTNKVSIVNADALAFLGRTTNQFDLLFCDPPYAWADYHALLELIFRRSLLAEDGLMLMEHSTQHNFSHTPEYLFHKDYGMTRVSFFQPPPLNQP